MCPAPEGALGPVSESLTFLWRSGLRAKVGGPGRGGSACVRGRERHAAHLSSVPAFAFSATPSFWGKTLSGDGIAGLKHSGPPDSVPVAGAF